MNSALWLLIASLVAWGWLLGTGIAAGVLLAVVLLSRFSPWRWQITLNQFYRWGDLSSLLTVLLLLYVYVLQPVTLGIFVLLKWLPALFAPVLLAQLFSSGQKLPLGTFFYSFRKRQQTREMDFQLPYTGLTLLSAGAANVQDARYFAVVVILLAAMLWSIRPQKQSAQAKIAWLIIMLLAINISYLGQQGLKYFQAMIAEQTIEWLTHWQTDPFKTQTSIGDVGQLKLSDSIAFRVKAKQPLLLLQTSYDLYFGQSWGVSKQMFMAENPTKVVATDDMQQLEILQQFNQREEVLALPDGTTKIQGLEGAVLQYNEFGAVKISDTPDFANYQVFFSGKRRDMPGRFDLKTPKEHADWLKQLTGEMKLAGLKQQAVADAIVAYFHRHFYYSLYLGSEKNAELALRDFMLKRKAGHCEYFAVASVLLLRQMGIPARLANGYAVEEYDDENAVFLVRQRHAHAWAQAYINGQWQVVDSTPSQWLAMENEHASVWQPLSDWFSNVTIHFKQWQVQQQDKQDLLWLAAAFLLSLYIGWRIYSAKQQLTRTNGLQKQQLDGLQYPGLDSEFYLIEQQFVDTAQARGEHESMAQWVERLQKLELKQLYQLHYQLRFDPVGISDSKRKQLQQQVASWLNQNIK